MRLLALCLLCLLTCSAHAALPVHTGYPASLFYLIEQLSGWNTLLPSGDYRSFWEARFGMGPDERRLLSEYVRIRRAYALPVVSQASSAPLLSASDAFELGSKWPLLFCRNRSLEAAWLDAQVLLSEADSASLRRVFTHFDARFRSIWEADRPALERAARRFSIEGWDRKLSAFASEAAPLFGAPPRPESFEAALVWQPDPALYGGSLRASLHDRILLVQLPASAGVEEAVELAAHELIHGLFHSTPAPAVAELQQALLRPGLSAGLLAWQGLDEGLATALGNGVFRARHQPQRFASARPWYQDRDIDAYAKAAYPVVTQALANGQNLASTAGALLAALSPLHAEKPVSLSWALRSFILVSDDAMRSVEPVLGEALRARGIWRCADQESGRLKRLLGERWAMPVILLISPEALTEALGSALDWRIAQVELPGLREQAQRGVVVVGTESARGRPYLLICGKPQAVTAALPEIARLEVGGPASPPGPGQKAPGL